MGSIPELRNDLVLGGVRIGIGCMNLVAVISRAYAGYRYSYLLTGSKI